MQSHARGCSEQLGAVAHRTAGSTAESCIHTCAACCANEPCLISTCSVTLESWCFQPCKVSRCTQPCLHALTACTLTQDHYNAGLLLEYVWHIVFGEPAVYHAPAKCDLLVCDDVTSS